MREIVSGRSVFFQSRTQLNTPGLGTLMPEMYRKAAEFSGQCRKLFPLELLQALEVTTNYMEQGIIFDWISVFLPVKVLRDPALESLMVHTCDQFDVIPGKICAALPEKVLAESDGIAPHAIGNLRRRGFHVMITNFGESGCPYLKLSEMPADYVLLSPGVTQYLGKGARSDQAVHSIIEFINDLGCEPIADGVKNSTQAETLYGFGCSYCAGPLSGFYLPPDSAAAGRKK
jgi:EAL domain-containing protein (putative c-di-GMP-specific phosphodiesterase class I)